MSYYCCKVGGCTKQYRVIRYHDDIIDDDDENVSKIFIEEVAEEDHDHDAADVVARGLTAQQKEIVLLCHKRRQGAPKSVIAEFERLARIQVASNLPVVPTPKKDMISSFLSHHRKTERGGIAVGSTTLQDLQSYAVAHMMDKSTVSSVFSQKKKFAAPVPLKISKR